MDERMEENKEIRKVQGTEEQRKGGDARVKKGENKEDNRRRREVIIMALDNAKLDVNKTLKQRWT